MEHLIRLKNDSRILAIVELLTGLIFDDKNFRCFTLFLFDVVKWLQNLVRLLLLKRWKCMEPILVLHARTR